MEPVTLTGATFTDITRRLWTRLGSHVKPHAVKTGDEWSVEPPTFSIWPRLMQFRFKKHPIHGTRDEEDWNKWVPTTKGLTVDLLVYKYGVAITKNSELEEFERACIPPLTTDRSGAAAERELREVVQQLQTKWGSTYRAEAIVWRMWASYVVENLDRSTWESRINDPSPPRHVAGLLRPANTNVEAHLTNMNRSVALAQQCVNAALVQCNQLQADYVALGTRMETLKETLAARKEVLDSFMANVLPVPMNMVADPTPRMENVLDVEHEE